MSEASVSNHSVVGVRQRRWRQRQKFPVHVVAKIEYERDAVLQALIKTKRLSQAEVQRRDLVDRELSLVIALWAEVNKHHD
jgi:hypothetical protein